MGESFGISASSPICAAPSSIATCAPKAPGSFPPCRRPRGPPLKRNGEVFNQIALVRQRHRRNDRTLCLALHRGGENLFGRHIRVEECTVQQRFAAAHPLCVRDQAAGEIGAVLAKIVQALKVTCVQLLIACFEGKRCVLSTLQPGRYP